MSYEPLPTKGQIDALTKINDLDAIRDEIDRRCAKIETDLDFLDATEDWERRARNALAFHRYTASLVGRRIKALTMENRSPMAGLHRAKTVTRERTECDELSWQLIEAEPIDATLLATPEEVDAALQNLNQKVAALERDRADEVARFVPAARDEAWMAEANAALKLAKGWRHQLHLRQASFRQARKLAQQAARDAERGQVFIDEAKAILSKETYQMIWDRVDRRQIADHREEAA